MSASPARPGRPAARSRPRSRRVGVEPVAQQPEHSPGSTLPERVAMTRPSSGVKPIVVSTQRPSRTAASDAPAPRWQVTTDARRRQRARPRRRRRATGRGSRSGAARSARATPAAARRWPPPPAASRGTRCRSRRRAGTPGSARRDRVDARQRRRLVQRRESASARSAASTSSSTTHGVAEALAAVHDAVADRVQRGQSGERGPERFGVVRVRGRARPRARRRGRAGAA